ncbi:MAG: 16S rRNA (guanine(966)-N(2))-methyltransferase RsmD [Verrucomicrobiales bacterium]|nr:16S rRNA (guanine(966)-N(2))-methyltransferase RsmD [Verrucomicrobiales bacterium]MCP5556822.1 16S rRNA (guanine(966)-N(2))-methyltransferase RsmD [Verrucomicrobiaceae bacterium]
MRIIAGTAGGIPIKVPPDITRPTTDRVREALFSMLGDIVVDARVLDLYAGSGSLGLEALSRGATHATFVDQNRIACSIITENLRKARLTESATVKQAPVARALEHLRHTASQFDLVFADPPYAEKAGATDDPAFGLLDDEDLLPLMAAGSTIVLECRAGKSRAPSPERWNLLRDRDYGGTRILWLEKKSPCPAP